MIQDCCREGCLNRIGTGACIHFNEADQRITRQHNDISAVLRLPREGSQIRTGP